MSTFRTFSNHRTWKALLSACNRREKDILHLLARSESTLIVKNSVFAHQSRFTVYNKVNSHYAKNNFKNVIPLTSFQLLRPCSNDEKKAHHKGESDSDVKRKELESSEKKNGALQKFKEMLNTFWEGCKQLLWVDARKAWATKRKLKRHDYDLTILTREELRHLRQTQKDIIKSLPVALLFFIPFIGYFAPVIGYLFPKRLLSHQFWDIEQRKKFAFEDHSKRSQYYLPLVQELGWSSRELQNQQLFSLCIKVIDGCHIENESIIKLKDVFKDDVMSIKKMPRFHLIKLCKTWLLPVKWYIPSKVLREFLSYRIKQIIEDDAAIRRDGIGILSDLCLRQACHARGLDKYSFAIPLMKEWLEDWLRLTASVSVEDKSFVAHCAAIKTMNFSKTKVIDN
ncbi:LETM1 domain-containing protein 1-like [Rhopilema esculentum]|uniref:LETM1 domain-containing protein 1-like n=1 Tax=Rhopilema esculentum TaxID=499914 RepID=UPI0031E35DAB